MTDARVEVIAEIGSCHDGSQSKFHDLIMFARDIGCDAVKAQWLSSAERLVARRRAPEYLDAYRVIAHSFDWIMFAREWTALFGMKFYCTAYLPEDVPQIAQVAHGIKVASFESHDDKLVEKVRSTMQPLLVSTGMMAAMDTSQLCRKLKPRDTVFHCVSAYPTPPEQSNLRAIRWLFGAVAPGVRVGLSDHSGPKVTVSGALAVALGAQAIEFHIGLPTTEPGNPDRAVAKLASYAKEYVAAIRYATAAVYGSPGVKGVQDAEEPMRKYLASEPVAP